MVAWSGILLIFVMLLACIVRAVVFLRRERREQREALHHFQEVIRYELGAYQLVARPDFCPVHRGHLRCLCVLRGGARVPQDEEKMYHVVSALAVAEGRCWDNGAVPTQVLRPYPPDEIVLCHVLLLP